MTEMDQRIFEIYEALEGICRETSELFKAIDQLMVKKRFVTFSYFRWDTSEAIDNPEGWLPYFSQRMYRREQGNPKLAIGINLMMKDEECQNRIPFLTCGLVRSSAAVGNKGNELYFAGWHEGYSVTRFADTYFSLSRNEDQSTEVLSYFLRLTAADRLESAERLIVEPLAHLYQSLGSVKSLEEHTLKKMNEKIGPSSLTLEQIRQP
jgi:hypothetical protein